MKFVTAGGLRIDFLISHDNQAHTHMVGGNALYTAVGAALWADNIMPWARAGENYPREWLRELSRHGIVTNGLAPAPGRQDHRTFFAYRPNGDRDDMNPRAHFARIGQELPPELADYVHSTPGQDSPTHFEPLALRPGDWSDALKGATAVHLAPQSLASHLTLPAFLRKRGIQQITLDPGERYMIPEREAYIRQILPQIDIFLPSDMEVRSLFGEDVDLWETAVTLTQWGANTVIIKNGPNGVLIVEKNGKRTHLPAYHADDTHIKDMTGAGDAFCGGFMVGLAQTHDPIQAAQRGLISASFVLEGYGAPYALKHNSEKIQTRLAIYAQNQPMSSASNKCVNQFHFPL